MTTKTKVTLYTDGACSGNPGKGGYGAILVHIDANGIKHEKEFSEGYQNTTNNQMELTAVIKALEALKEPCEVLLTTDSKYVCDSITKGWVYSWQKNGWRKADKKPALNPDLWDKLLILLSQHEYEFEWVKGHAGNTFNEQCDELAVKACKRPTLTDPGYESQNQ